MHDARLGCRLSNEGDRNNTAHKQGTRFDLDKLILVPWMCTSRYLMVNYLIGHS